MSIQEFSPIQPVALRAETTQEDKAATKIQAAWRGLSVRLSKEPLSKDWECAICMDGFESPGAEGIFKGENAIKTTPCKHTFHKHCLVRSAQESPAGNQCPLCRGTTGITVRNGREPISDVANARNLEEINRLIAAEVDVNQADQHGNNHWIYAVIRNISDVGEVNPFLDDFAELNPLEVNVYRRTFPDREAFNGDIEIVNALIAAEANVNRRGRDQQTSLEVAVSRGNIQMLNTLIAGGADVNRDGESPLYESLLHRAAERGSIGIVNALITAGADQTIRDRLGHIPFDVALNSMHFNCAWALSTAALLLKTFTRGVVGAGIGVSLYMKYLESQSESNGDGV